MTNKLIDIDFVIIGGQKSGSTFIQTILDDHPDIYIPHNEQAYFEDGWHDKNNRNNLITDINKNTKSPLLGIKRPSYFSKPEVPKRLHSELHNPKLFLILRNPIDRFISAYYHYINYSLIKATDINKGIPILIEKGQFDDFPRSKELLSFSLYSDSLKKYLELFEKNNICIILFDDIISNKKQIIKDAYDFLNVDSNHSPSSLNKKPQSVIYSLERLTFRNNYLNKYLYTYNSFNNSVELNSNLFKLGVSFLIDRFDKLVLSRLYNNNKPLLNKDNILLLKDYFQNDINIMEELIDRDLTMWK